MKKSLLNLAISMTISGAVFSGSVLSTQVYASDFTSADNNNSNDETTETYMLPGLGVGAATGGVIAGPVGLLIGGFIGAIVGSNQNMEQSSDEVPATVSALEQETTQNIIAISSKHVEQQNNPVFSNNSKQDIQVAQLGPISSVADDSFNSQQEEIMNILITDLSLDVYFRSGSADIESFYPVRLTAIADLMHTMDKLEIHLDGYTDRRGDKSKNIALANERIDKVREQLINAGVEDNRIISKAFGEAKMKSSAGDLEAYTFDRRVVIRFERAISSSTDNSMATALSDSNAKNNTAAVSDESLNAGISPVVADANPRF